ncbi:MAG: acyltransferase [Ramlibacter sp.]|nr:acyltransferase [Ramlibacter sp.]
MLRASAAIFVCFFHAMATANGYGYPVIGLHLLEGWGWGGVDLFFVISGFIMVYVQRTKQATPTEFFVNRVVRIAPLYWLLTLLLAALIWSVPAAFNTKGIPVDWTLASLGFTSQLIFDRMPVLFDGWTLEFEMMFYVLFAASLALKDFNRSVAVCCGAVVVWAVLSRQYLVLEFAMGMCIGWAFVRRRFVYERPIVPLAVGLAAFLLTVWTKPGVADRVVHYGIPAALILYGSIYIHQSTNRVFIRIGDASYAIYLVQVFTVSAFYKLVKYIAPPAALSDLYAAVCVLVTVGAGCLIYAFVESPLARLSAPLKKRYGK